MSKINVAVVNTQPPHLYFGGVERRIIEIARHLSEKVHTTVYCGSKKRFHKATVLNGIRIIPCFSTDIVFPLDNWSFNKTLSRFQGNFGADVIEVHTASGFGLIKNLQKKKATQALVHTIHGVLADEYSQLMLEASLDFRSRLSNHMLLRLSKLEAKLAEHANLVVTVSACSLNKIIHYYQIDPCKVRVIPNGVDCARFKSTGNGELVRRRLSKGDSPIVLFVGGLIPRKGIFFLLEAAKEVVRENSKVMFVIAGDGPMRGTMLSFVRHNKLSKNFAFLGSVPDAVLPKVYDAADIFVLPSIQEGQGIALLEAQATGKPVVAFNIGGVREAVRNGKTGLLVQPDSHALGEAVLKLLADERLRKDFGTKGSEFVCRNFSWEACAEKMLQVYEEVSDDPERK